MKYKKVTILGIGLIGGAIGIDLKKKKLAQEVCAWGRNPKHLKQAVSMGACDTSTRDIASAVENADIIILATPPQVILNQLSEIKPYLKDGMLVMDVGSIKGTITGRAEQEMIYKTGAEFVGCHPMAGSEKTGVENAEGRMFINAPCILTPGSSNTVDGVEKAKVFWQELGANVVVMDPDEHDLYIGFVSHLPHVISSTIMNTSTKKLRNMEEISKFCGPSFIEMTRIAGSSPQMWSQIYFENRKQVLLAIDTFKENLEKFREMLYKKDSKKLEEFLKKAKDLRDEICQ